MDRCGCEYGRRCTEMTVCGHELILDEATEKLRDEIEQLQQLLRDATDNPGGDYYTGLRCGVEDRDIRDRYEAAEYGWDQAFDYIQSMVDPELPESANGNEYPKTITLCGFPIKVIDTGNDNEVTFWQDGKIVGRIVLTESCVRECEKLRAEIEQLREGLHIYGRHLPKYNHRRDYRKCDCGFNGLFSETTKDSDDKRSCPNCFQRAVVKDGPGAWKCLNCDFENRPLLEQDS